jgi:hypothetical protein
MRGAEAKFARSLEKLLDMPFGTEFNVKVGSNLLHSLEIDASGQVRPNENERRDPKRGQLYAFETDILIEKTRPSIPLVVLELKYGAFSTHDVITYSSKATRHKQIYPYLRYGFVLGGSKSLSKKFLVHNQGIDFATSVYDVATDGQKLIQLVRRQIRDAEGLAAVMRNDNKTFTRYEKCIDVQS